MCETTNFTRIKPYPPLGKPAQTRLLWLFLDYDGTLVDFAPTPDDIQIDRDLIKLLVQLAGMTSTRVAIISGRKLDHLRKLIPINSIYLVGTYGLEIQWEDGSKQDLLDFSLIRPQVEKVKPHWEKIIGGHDDFYLEDKGWALAIHARFANHHEAEQVLSEARRITEEHWPGKEFILQGDKNFLEIRPLAAHKGQAVRTLWDSVGQPDVFPVYLGDDDKDELAFGVVRKLDGMTILVRDELTQSQAEYGLASPQEVRRWLENLIEWRSRTPLTEP